MGSLTEYTVSAYDVLGAPLEVQRVTGWKSATDMAQRMSYRYSFGRIVSHVLDAGDILCRFPYGAVRLAELRD